MRRSPIFSTGIEVGKDTYVENLEELIWELHSALELTVYDIEDVDARGDTICKAQRLWDEYCSIKHQHYLFSNNEQ